MAGDRTWMEYKSWEDGSLVDMKRFKEFVLPADRMEISSRLAFASIIAYDE